MSTKTQGNTKAVKTVVTNVETLKALNKAKNSAKREELKEQAPKSPIYLAEGVTGKQFTQAKRDTNTAVKVERATISRCMSDIFEQDKGFFESLKMSKGQAKKKFSPATLIHHATDNHILNYFMSNRNTGSVRFNTWYTLEYMKKVLCSDAVNPNAVLFFKALKANDEVTIIELLRVITRARQ